jgi:hypothetical protein
MTVLDDLHRLAQLDSIYLGWSVPPPTPQTVTVITCWHKGRLQQSNDASWTFRSISADGTIVGFQLGLVAASWTSSETPAAGTTVTITIVQAVTVPAPINSIQLGIITVNLQQLLPQELTN